VASHTAELAGGKWTEVTVEFATTPGTPVDEVRFKLESGELLLDDVLLYTPGR